MTVVWEGNDNLNSVLETCVRAPMIMEVIVSHLKDHVPYTFISKLWTLYFPLRSVLSSCPREEQEYDQYIQWLKFELHLIDFV